MELTPPGLHWIIPPLHPLLLQLPRTVFRNTLFYIDACKAGDAPLIPCAFTSVRALPLGIRGNFSGKKEGERPLFAIRTCLPRECSSCTGRLQGILSIKHNPALRGSVKMAKAFVLPFVSPSIHSTCHRLRGRERLLFPL